MLLLKLAPDWKVEVLVAATPEEAKKNIEFIAFDLITVDLSLRADDGSPLDVNREGGELFEAIAASEKNRWTALIVVSARADDDSFHMALSGFNVHKIIRKQAFKDAAFHEACRRAMMAARLRRAAEFPENRYLLTFSLDEAEWRSCQISGCENFNPRYPKHACPVDIQQMADEADLVGDLLETHGQRKDLSEKWRKQAQKTGQKMYEILENIPEFKADITRFLDFNEKKLPVWMSFSGPSAALALPVELMRRGDDDLARQMVITRSLANSGETGKKAPPFYRFIGELWEKKLPLRVLLVAANSDGMVPGVDVEIKTVAKIIKRECDFLGLGSDITLIPTAEADYERVQRALGEHYHIFHFAGHGRFNENRAESSELDISSGTGKRLTAGVLHLMLARSGVQLALLSCCLGGRSAAYSGGGDFRGTLEALARTGVPFVLGHRWIISDMGGLYFAANFYENLLQHFLPGSALLAARQEVYKREGGDSSTWMAPVLVSQSD